LKQSNGGVHTLRDLIDEGREHVQIACEKCGRGETHSLASLLVRHGMSKRLADIIVQMRAECPKVNEHGQDGCGAVLQIEAREPRSGD
jgi:hypothetical protein